MTRYSWARRGSGTRSLADCSPKTAAGDTTAATRLELVKLGRTTLYGLRGRVLHNWMAEGEQLLDIGLEDGEAIAHARAVGADRTERQMQQRGHHNVSQTFYVALPVALSSTCSTCHDGRDQQGAPASHAPF